MSLIRIPQVHIDYMRNSRVGAWSDMSEPAHRQVPVIFFHCALPVAQTCRAETIAVRPADEGRWTFGKQVSEKASLENGKRGALLRTRSQFVSRRRHRCGERLIPVSGISSPPMRVTRCSSEDMPSPAPACFGSGHTDCGPQRYPVRLRPMHPRRHSPDPN
jgi:hypothetical protein